MAEELETRLELLRQTLVTEISEIMIQHERRLSAQIKEWHQQQEIATELQHGLIEDSLTKLRDMLRNEPAPQSEVCNISTSKPEVHIPQETGRPYLERVPLRLIDNCESPYAPARPSEPLEAAYSPINPESQVIDTSDGWSDGLRNTLHEMDVPREEDVSKLSEDHVVDNRGDSHHVLHDSGGFRNTLVQPLMETPGHRIPRGDMLKEQPSCLRRAINHPIFDAVLGVAILGNTVFIGYSAEYAARHYENPTDKSINQTEWFFTILFTVEVIVRMIALKPRMYFFGEDCWWNLFDLTLVTTSLWSQLVDAVAVSASGHVPNTMGLRILRLLRLLKMFRVVRIARFMRELRTIVSSIVGSMRTLFWSMVMMALILYIFGLVFLQAATAVMPDKTLDIETRAQLSQYWGSMYKSMLTLYMATTGGEDWAPMASPLVAAGDGYYYLFLFYISFLSMAILNVVMGLFVDAAMKATEKDRIELIKEAADDQAGFQDSVIELFNEYDLDGNGNIDKAELEHSFSLPKMQAFMQHLEVDRSEILTIFEIMVNKNGGEVAVEDLVQGCFRVSRGAKSIDIMQMMDTQETLNEKVTSMSQMVEKIHTWIQGAGKLLH